MFVRRIRLRNISFHSLFQPVNISQCSTITLITTLTKRFSSSVKDDPQSLPGSHTDDEVYRKKKLIESEMVQLRDRGRRMPELSFLKQEHWKELLEMKTISARRKHYKFLFSIEERMKNRKLKKQERAQDYLASKEQRLKVESTHTSYSLGKTPMFLRIYPQTMNMWRNRRLIQAMKFGAKIIYDCSYDQYMSSKEAHSAASQLMYSFTQNRLNRDPFDLHFCNVNFNGKTFTRLQTLIPTLRSPGFPLNVYEGSYLDHFPKEKLVYLTPHCRNDLTEYDPDSIFIIGAMVDTSGQGPLSMTKATELGLKMARLPLDRYLHRNYSPLTLDQMMQIMLELKSSGNWSSALKHVPRQTVVNRVLCERKPVSSIQFGKNFGSKTNTFDDDLNSIQVEANELSAAETLKRTDSTSTAGERSEKRNAGHQCNVETS